jgi:hypothetical protein
MSVRLRHVGTDPTSTNNGSPTLWIDEDRHRVVVQGWIADARIRAACLETGPIPGHEQVVELPESMMPFLAEVVDEWRRSGTLGGA